jgi:GT2 family glycosyltransferase
MHTIVVIDDGSTDQTDEMIKTEFPEVVLLKGDGNLFWTAATNMGIKYALQHGADYIMTLNNDTVASINFIEKMVHWAKLKPEALLGALGLDIATKEPNYGGEIFNWVSGSSRILLNELKEQERFGLHMVSHFAGRGLLIPQKVFKSIGLFAEKKLPHYLADFDFTSQARRNGFHVYCNYDAHLYTYPEESSNRKLVNDKNIKNYLNHLFSIKGGANLRDFTHYALRNCPKSVLPIALVVGYVRRIGGYWFK